MNKKILMILAITVLAMEAGAKIKPLSVHSGKRNVSSLAHTTRSSKHCATPFCNNFAGAGKRYCPSCQKAIEQREKEQKERVKELRTKIAVDKFESPAGLRIWALCGYELGSVLELPCDFKVDEKGNVIVQAKLKQPFRKCTQVELRYSSKALALYQITLYSEDLKGMSEEEVQAEIEGMKAVLDEKFKAEIGFWMANMAIISNPASPQYLTVAYNGRKIEKASLEKTKKVEQVWTVSVMLRDFYFENFIPEEFKPPVDTESGYDVL